MSDDVLDLLARLTSDGWTADFHARPEGFVLCDRCDESVPASEVSTAGYHRIEDDTDPEAQTLIVEATCPRCSARGTLVCGYGSAAGDDDAAVIASLPAPT